MITKEVHTLKKGKLYLLKSFYFTKASSEEIGLFVEQKGVYSFYFLIGKQIKCFDYNLFHFEEII